MQEPTLIQLILLQVTLILLNAVFACAEIAVISMHNTRIEQLAQEGDQRARRLGRIKKNPARFLATIQVAITLSGFLASAFAADNFSDQLADLLQKAGFALPLKTLDTISVVLITLILSYFTLVFGELVPKRLAMKKTEKLSLALSGLIAFISRLFAPVVGLLTVSTNFVLRLLRIDPAAEEDSISEEDIRLLIAQGTKKGVIAKEESQLLHNVFEFDNLAISEFATHRTEIVPLWLGEPLEEWEKIFYSHHFTRYLVCDKSIDDIIGIVDVRDYFRLKNRTLAKVLAEAITPAYFVPATLKADVLFRQMKQTHSFFAVVLDEYGGTFGIVTMKDLVEQLVGKLTPEEDETASSINRLSSDSWQIGGQVRLDDVAETLGVTLPLNAYDTFGGYVFGVYGSVPRDGAHFEIQSDGLTIRALQIQAHKLITAEVRKTVS